MTTARTRGVAALSLAAGAALAGCQAAAEGTEAESGEAPAVVQEAPDGGPPRLVLTEQATQRLGLQTSAVTGAPGDLTVPYSAVIYDAEGGAWVFVELEPRVYQRAPLSVTAIEGDVVRLGAGPEPGTGVVTVAAPELVGVEAGFSGGE